MTNKPQTSFIKSKDYTVSCLGAIRSGSVMVLANTRGVDVWIVSRPIGNIELRGLTHPFQETTATCVAPVRFTPLIERALKHPSPISQTGDGSGGTIMVLVVEKRVP